MTAPVEYHCDQVEVSAVNQVKEESFMAALHRSAVQFLERSGDIRTTD